MEAHAGFDFEIRIMPKSRHRIAAGPGWRLPDADAVAAMMAPVMLESGIIDDLLPGGIDGFRSGAGLDRRYYRIEGLAYDSCDPGIFLAQRTYMDEPAERRVIARDAA